MPKRSAQTNNGGPLQKKAKTNPQPGRLQRTALVSAPVAQARQRRMNAPQIEGLRNGDCIVTHREYIQDITAGSGSPSAFSVNSFSVNPAQSATFPWLASIASRFESYVFEKLEFCYETEAPSSLGGSMVISLDYDASDSAPASKQQALAYRNATRSAPWTECRNVSAREDLAKQKTFFCRPGAVPANSDIKLYDVANAFVCTQNVTTASAVCGELYVDYRVRLMTPVYEPSPPSNYGLSSAGLSSAVPTGTNFSTSTSGSLVFTQLSANTISVAGLTVGQKYLASGNFAGTGISSLDFGTSLTGGTVQDSIVIFPNGAGTRGVHNLQFVATATTAVFTVAATATTLTAMYFLVSQLPAAPSLSGLF